MSAFCASVEGGVIPQVKRYCEKNRLEMTIISVICK